MINDSDISRIQSDIRELENVLATKQQAEPKDPEAIIVLEKELELKRQDLSDIKNRKRRDDDRARRDEEQRKLDDRRKAPL